MRDLAHGDYCLPAEGKGVTAAYGGSQIILFDNRKSVIFFQFFVLLHVMLHYFCSIGCLPFFTILFHRVPGHSLLFLFHRVHAILYYFVLYCAYNFYYFCPIGCMQFFFIFVPKGAVHHLLFLFHKVPAILSIFVPEGECHSSLFLFQALNERDLTIEPV
jgi:hypothetical protein